MTPILALSDAHAGNARQARALAQALGGRIEAVPLEPRAPWRWLAPHRLPGDRRAFGPDFERRLAAPWPALAIGCGRQAALATRLLRAASGGTCRSIQILDPRIDPAHFDLVVAPAHDGLEGTNVIRTLGALNPIDDAWLASARARFAALLALPAPRLAVLLGGPTRALALDQAYWNALAARLRAWQRDTAGSLLLAGSRRSPAWLRQAARAGLADLPGSQWHGPADGENPYAGYLACADAILVTPDSVNMLSEACATTVPVWTFAPRPIPGKIGRFVGALHECGRIGFFGEAPRPGPITPLRETARVAEEIRRRLHWAPA